MMTNKILVVYKSETGYTKKYAEWLSQELSCDIKENKKLALEDLEPYSTIIYGGALYAIGINGLSLIKKNFESLKDKKLILFAVGATPPREKDLQKVWETNLTEEQRAVIHTFYCRGGFDYSKLNTGNKLLMNMMKKKLKTMKNPDEDALGMLEAFDKPVDFTDKQNIIPILELINKDI